jgi:GntR family transcriptional regulator
LIQSGVIDKSSVIPIYHQLFKYLEKQIRGGDLKPGNTLPTEAEMSAAYGISRMTVRRAVSELAAANLIYTQKGRGTFVARPKLDNVVFDLNNFYEEIRHKGLEPHAKLLDARVIRADQKLATRLGIAANTRCLFFRMAILANGEPVAYEEKCTVYRKRVPIIESELRDPSLSNLAAVHSDILPASSKKVLMVSTANEVESKALGVIVGCPVFLMIQTIYDRDQRVLAYGKSVYRGDRTKLISYDGWNVDEALKPQD